MPITQTNRTMLFDVVNPEVNDLFTLLSDVDESSKSLTDEKIKEINDALLVKNFDDFLEKFKPTIYSYLDKENGMVYDLIKPLGIPEALVKKIVIDKSNTFLKMFTSLIDRKNATGVSNVLFDYQKVTEMLAPHNVLKQIMQIKKEIKYLEKKNAEAESDSPAKEDAVRKLAGMYEKTKKYYNEPASQLLVMAGVIRENLKYLSQTSGNGGAAAQPVAIVFGDNGEAELKELAPGGSADKLLGGGKGAAAQLSAGGEAQEAPNGGALVQTEGAEGSKALAEVSTESSADASRRKIDYSELSITTIENQFDESMESLYLSINQPYERSENSLPRQLVVSAFTGKMSDSLDKMTVPDKVNLYNKYMKMNNEWQKAFIRKAKPLLEKILGIKTFFDQYQSQQKLMQPTMLILNAHMLDIIEEDNLIKLGKYLNTVNNVSDYSNTIWFGIVPGIKYSETSEDLFNPEIFEKMGYDGDIDKGVQIEPTDISDLQVLLQCAKEYKIQIFFSFETNQDTTFSEVQTKGIDRYMSLTEGLAYKDYSSYAIPCLPNFTVLPSASGKVVTGTKVTQTQDGGIMFSKNVEDFVRFWIYGVYIGAAYVAAGIVAAYQCPKFLETRFKDSDRRVKKDSPGVRFAIEDGSNYLYVTSTLGKEVSAYTDEIKDIIDTNKYGFVFSSDTYQLNGKPVNKITVYKARCMQISESKGGYESIFMETTRTYLYRVFGIETNGFRKPAIDNMFGPSGLISKWKLSPNFVNSILSEADDIKKGDLDGTVYNINIEFSGVSEIMSVNINSD